jgi:hypothetical protein
MRRGTICRPDASSWNREKGLAGGAGGGNERPCSLAWMPAKSVQDACRVAQHGTPKMENRSNKAAPEGSHFFRAQSRMKLTQLRK